MNYFPSPPSSPYLGSFILHHDYNTDASMNDNDEEYSVKCGACDKPLGSDWFCSDCHQKCNTCNRFLSQDDEYCSRCWLYDPVHQMFLFKNTKHFLPMMPCHHNNCQSSPQQIIFSGIPSPSNSTGAGSAAPSAPAIEPPKSPF